MGCHACSWLRPRAPVAIATSNCGSAKPQPVSLLLFSYKPADSTVSCSTGGSTDSPSRASTRSYGRRWYNPLRHPQPDQPSPDILRRWIDSDNPLASQERIVVVSYNILADRNAWKHRDLYPNVPFRYMNWDHRKRVICQELIGLKPDIICLQEVDRYLDLLSIMEKAGYVGSYKRRTGDNVDGCATFWKVDRFRLLEGESIEFKGVGLRDNVAQLSVFEVFAIMHPRQLLSHIFFSLILTLKVNALGKDDSDMTNISFKGCSPTAQDCHKVAPITYDERKRQIMKAVRRNLTSSGSNWHKQDIGMKMCEAESRRLLVGNIHVIYNPSRGDVKLGQVRLLSSRAQMLLEKWGNIPVVLAGDFNSTPRSPIYNFLSSSELNIMSLDRRALSGQRDCHPAQVLGVKSEKGSPLILMERLLKSCWTSEELKAATGSVECHLAVHPLKLSSSYATVKGSGRSRGSSGEPLATSYHSKFLGTVDYLWYSGGLVPTRVLDTLPIDVLQKTGGLPCKIFGSDHLALVSEFSFTEGMTEGNQTTKTSLSDASPPVSAED